MYFVNVFFVEKVTDVIYLLSNRLSFRYQVIMTGIEVRLCNLVDTAGNRFSS